MSAFAAAKVGVTALIKRTLSTTAMQHVRINAIVSRRVLARPS